MQTDCNNQCERISHNNDNAMKVFQGEPIGFKINGRIGEEYVQDFSDITIEAIFYNEYTTVKKGWTTKNGSITVGTEEYSEGETRAFAAFSLTGTETAKLPSGRYDFAMSVTRNDDGKAIGEVNGVVYLRSSVIKDGVNAIEL